MHYKENIESKIAVHWLRKKRSWLFGNDNQTCVTFNEYLEKARLSFENKENIISEYGSEVDAFSSPSDDYTIIHISKERWEKRKGKENTALQIHELSEGYLLNRQYFFNSKAAHTYSEYLETLFRKDRNMDKCPICPLPESIIPKIEKFEKKLQKSLSNFEFYDAEKILREHVNFWKEY